MSKEQVKAILDRVLTWPEQRQEDAAKMLMLMESTDQSVYRLTDEQVAEVRRRIANPDRKLLSRTEARERILRLGS
jgi:NH3-dependent NAD+ synthetase